MTTTPQAPLSEEDLSRLENQSAAAQDDFWEAAATLRAIAELRASRRPAPADLVERARGWCDKRGLLRDHYPEQLAALLASVRDKEREACAQKIRHDCVACDGTGHASADSECEYCGRPIAAIRARGQQGG